MFKHDFHSIGDCGHKRNFIYYHGKKIKLTSVRDFCGICEKPVKYEVLQYWEEPVLYGCGSDRAKNGSELGRSNKLCLKN